MKNILNRLIQHEILTKEEAKDVLVNISSGSYNPSQIAAFMTVYMMRSITIEELAGFREALLELCIPVDFSAYNQNLSTDAFNYWRNPGDTNVGPAPTVNGIETTDAFLQKTDFIRFRSLEVGYTFDKKFLGTYIPVNSIRVYGSGQNLALWTNFTGDPEVAVASETQVNNGAFVPGAINLYNYPTTRTFLIGLQVNF